MYIAIYGIIYDMMLSDIYHMTYFLYDVLYMIYDVWHDMTRHGTTRHDTARHGTVWCNIWYMLYNMIYDRTSMLNNIDVSCDARCAICCSQMAD